MRKFTRLTLVLIIFIIHTIVAKSQTVEWAKRAGLYAFDYGYGICTDKAGNVYVAGKYELNAEFGGIPVTCAGNHDIFVAKYNAAGAFQWVRTAGGYSGDYAHAVTCDPEGNVYLTGEFELTTHFGTTDIISNGGNDIFVAKYATDGTLQWAKSLGGGPASDRGYGISCSANSVYVTGNFQGTVIFGGKTITSAGLYDIFLAKYTVKGDLLWVKTFGGTGEDEGKALRQDAAGNVFMTGFFSNTVNFGGTSYNSSGQRDIFLAKYDSSGAMKWAKKAGGTGDDYSLAIAMNKDGIFLTGGFTGTCSFEGSNITSSGAADIFAARYSLTGTRIWAKKMGGTAEDCGRGIDLDAASNMFITGNYGYAASFDAISVTGVDASEIYFASLDLNGKARWVVNVGGEVDAADDAGVPGEMGMCIATDPTGNAIASGAYRSNSVFGGLALAPYVHSDIFITKIKPDINKSTDLTVYFKKPANYSEAKIYFWNTVPATTAPAVAWPGLTMNPMTKYGPGWYSYTISSTSSANMIFNDGAGKQTGDLFTDRKNWYDGNTMQWVAEPQIIVTGYVEKKDNETLTIYPNPSSSALEINYNFSGEKNLDIKIVDAIGNLMYHTQTKSYSTYNNKIENSEWPNGLYFLVITEDSHSTYKKILVNH
jgi:hypothetical protein